MTVPFPHPCTSNESNGFLRDKTECAEDVPLAVIATSTTVKFRRFGKARITDISVESEHRRHRRQRVVILLGSPCEMCSSISSEIRVSDIPNASNELKFLKTRPKNAGSFHSSMRVNPADLTWDKIPPGSRCMCVYQLFTMDSVRNRIVEKARCWLLIRHRLATREEEERVEAGRLSMISSIISWGSESMAS